MKTTLWCSDRFQGPPTPQFNVFIKKSIICRNYVLDSLDKLYNSLTKDTSIKFHTFELIRTLQNSSIKYFLNKTFTCNETLYKSVNKSILIKL